LFGWNSMHRGQGLRVISKGGRGRVGRVSGQFSHQGIGLLIDDVRILSARVAQLLELRHDRGACILAARDGPNFFSLSECSHFGNRPEHLSRGSDLTGFCLGVW